MIIRKYFSEKSEELKILGNLRAVGAISSDASLEGELYRLCDRLSGRYFVIAEVPVNDAGRGVLSYSQTRPYFGETTDQEGYAGALPRPALRHAIFGGTSTSFRFHAFWAKRALAYYLNISVPSGLFFATQELAEQNSGGRLRIVGQSINRHYKWTIDTLQGGASHFLITGAMRERNRLFLVIRAFELPGRSTARAFTTSFAGFVLISIFTSLVQFGARPSPEIATVVLALFAVTGLALSPDEEPSLLGTPILSRVTAPLVAAVTTLFLLWLFSVDVSPNFSKVPAGPLRDLIVFAWPVWERWGGFACSILAAALLIRLLFRRANVAIRYSDAKSGFYDEVGVKPWN